MGKRGGGLVRDIYLLSSFVCLVASAAILYVLLVKYPDSSFNDKAVSLIPDNFKNDIGIFRFLTIGVSAFVCALSLISFVGLFLRSTCIIKFGLNLTIVVILAQVAVVGWFYFKDPTFEKTSATIWSNMSQDHKQEFMTEARCNSEQSCRENIKTILVESHPKFLLIVAIGIVVFQLASLFFGCFTLSAIQRSKRQSYVYQYPTSTLV